MGVSEQAAVESPYAIAATKSPWWQWDTGLQVSVGADVEMRQVHFANRPNGSAYVVDVVDGLADVPDELLQVPRPIKAWGYVPQDNGGVTYVEATFAVAARNKPSGYVWTRTAQKTIEDAEKARDEAKGYATDAEASADAAAESEKLAGEHAADAEAAAGTAAADAVAAAKPTLDQYKADAKASADNAKTSETNAKASADAAAKSAAEAKTAAGTAASDVTTSLQGYVTQAKAQADASKSSADSAAASAATAGTRADAAGESASSAAEQATAAQNYASQAKSSQSGAAASATSASTNADKAADSQGKAAASADAAAASAKEAADTVADCMKASTFGDVYGTAEPLLTTEEDSVYTTTLSHDASLAVTAGLLGVDRDVLAPSLNTLTGSATDTFVHVEDAFEGGTVRGFTIKGAYSQTTTTGKNLWPQIAAKTASGVTFTPYANRDGHADRGMVRVTGTATASYVYAGVQVALDAGTYTFKNFGYYKGSASSLAGAVYLRVRVVPTSGSQVTYNAFGNNATSFTVSEGDSVYLDVTCGTAGDVDTGAVMPVLVAGSTMLAAWEEYTGGKASPSPDYPQEVHVPGEAKVVVTNRTIAQAEASWIDNTVYPSIVNPPSGTTGLRNERVLPNVLKHACADPTRNSRNGYQLRLTAWIREGALAGDEYNPRLIANGTYRDFDATDFGIDNVAVQLSGTYTHSPLTVDTTIQFGTTFQTPGRNQVKHTVPIPLPAEHPYLAALPDGTCDEIVVGADGHAVLTARAEMIKQTTASHYNNKYYVVNPTPAPFSSYGDMTSGHVVSSGYLTEHGVANQYYRTWNSTLVGNTTATSLAEAQAQVDARQPLVSLVAVPPVTYDLGYVAMPPQPDRYLNAWVDGGDDYAIPELTMSYERDVNIVVEQLEQAVASVSTD